MEDFLLGGMWHTWRATNVAFTCLLGQLTIFKHIYGGRTYGDTSCYFWRCIFYYFMEFWHGQNLIPKLNETGKRLEVSEMGTAGNTTLQKWKRRGKRCVCVYNFF